MKKQFFFYLVMCLFIGTSTYAQNTQSLSACHSLEDTLQYLKKEFVESNRFVGKPAKELFQAFKNALPIARVYLIETSPWVDPKGYYYIDGITICPDKNWIQKFDAGKPFIRFQVYFEETHKDAWIFKRTIPAEEYTYESMLKYMEDFIVKKINIYIRPQKE